MLQSVSELREAMKQQMLTSVDAQRVIDKARRTPHASQIGKCIDIEFLHSHLSQMGITASRSAVDDLFNTLDPDGDGVVDYHSFLSSMLGSQTRDFLSAMQRLITSDSVRETRLRKAARRQRLANAAAQEITDPFELLKKRLESGDGSGNFRKAFRKFKCRSAQHLGEDSIDYRGFKKALISLGIEMSESKMRRVFNTIDKDGGRTIDYNEFANALKGESVSKSGVRDWAREVAQLRWKQKAAYEAVATLIRSPKALYVTLRNMFIGNKNAHKAFRSFLHLSGSSDALLDVQEVKRSLKAKNINCAPGVPEKLFRHLDPDNDGQLTFGEFTKAFIDMDLSQLIDLDLPPAESKFKLKRKKERPTAVGQDMGFAKLREAIRDRGTLRGLQLAFHRNRCTWKAVKGGVDIRGFQDALKMKGVSLASSFVKAAFFKLDPQNVGVVTYAQFRDAVQDVVPQQLPPQDDKRRSTLGVQGQPAGSTGKNLFRERISKTPAIRAPRGPATDKAAKSAKKTRMQKHNTYSGTGSLPLFASSQRLPKFRVKRVDSNPSKHYSKRDVNVALAAKSLYRARQHRQQKNRASGSIYRNPHTTIY